MTVFIRWYVFEVENAGPYSALGGSAGAMRTGEAQIRANRNQAGNFFRTLKSCA
jgi:hypothetical protein